MARNARSAKSFRVVVLGLGRFGESLARELVLRGTEVLAIDSDPALVQKYSDDLTHTAVADTTDADALRQLDVPGFRRAVVGIGTDLEASILTTAVLVDFEIEHIWAKAVSRQHGRVTRKVVFPVQGWFEGSWGCCPGWRVRCPAVSGGVRVSVTFGSDGGRGGVPWVTHCR